jgi:hypothetical protein
MTPTIPENMTSDTVELTRSPSVSSTSTVGSNSSTGKLIKRLSVHKNLNLSTDPATETSNEPPIPAVPTTSEQPADTSAPSGTVGSGAPLPKSGVKRKPIKFTVRKVSHEPVNTPSSDLSSLRDKGPSRQNSSSKSHDHHHHHSHHNLHSRQLSESKPMTKALAASQEKYDLYSSRIEKINKEIDFLNNLLPPYNVEIDYTTRTKIVRAIEKLRTKQDELSKKKYSLGITISRLWREQDAGTMWVRSVSN